MADINRYQWASHHQSIDINWLTASSITYFHGQVREYASQLLHIRWTSQPTGLKQQPCQTIADLREGPGGGAWGRGVENPIWWKSFVSPTRLHPMLPHYNHAREHWCIQTFKLILKIVQKKPTIQVVVLQNFCLYIIITWLHHGIRTSVTSLEIFDSSFKQSSSEIFYSFSNLHTGCPGTCKMKI